MRSVTWSDLRIAVRALRAVPCSERRQRARRLLHGAELADRHTRRLGRPHPRFGDGTLSGAAAGWPLRPEAGGIDAETRDTLILLFDEWAACRDR
jgi:hypothetical protein